MGIMDIDQDGLITLNDLNLILKNWDQQENNVMVLLDIIDNWGNIVGNQIVLNLKLSNQSLYENNETSNIPSFNWINTESNSNFSTLALTNPNEKKKIKINLDEMSLYNLSWTTNSNVNGNFYLVTNLYNNSYIEKINMLTQNSVTIDTKNIFTNQSLIENRNALNSIADLKKKKYL